MRRAPTYFQTSDDDASRRYRQPCFVAQLVLRYPLAGKNGLLRSASIEAQSTNLTGRNLWTPICRRVGSRASSTEPGTRLREQEFSSLGSHTKSERLCR